VFHISIWGDKPTKAPPLATGLHQWGEKKLICLLRSEGWANKMVSPNLLRRNAWLTAMVDFWVLDRLLWWGSKQISIPFRYVCFRYWLSAMKMKFRTWDLLFPKSCGTVAIRKLLRSLNSNSGTENGGTSSLRIRATIAIQANFPKKTMG